jgi:hypothetical protein
VERTRSSIAININKRGTNAPVIADTMMGDTKLKGNSAVCTLLLYRGGGGGERVSDINNRYSFDEEEGTKERLFDALVCVSLDLSTRH